MAFILYGRSWCHLCDDLRVALAPVAAEFRVAVAYLDIDADPALVARYDEDVPVLLLDGVEVCRHRFDAAAVRAALLRREARGAG
ncbi:MAG: glutaredoxin family protein [Burkholderia sp.]